MAYRLIGVRPPGLEARIVQTRNKSLMKLDLGEFVDWSIYCTGEWEPRETEIIRNALQPGDRMVDVGAYIGWFTLLAARQVGSSGEVIAFEANTSTHSKLVENVALNGITWATAHNFAVGDKPGRVRTGSRTVGNAGGDFVDFSASDDEGIEVVLLDQVLADLPVRLIKIDVEGAECKVLRGAVRLLSRDNAPDLVLEFTPEFVRKAGDDPHDVIQLLKDCDYRLFEIGKYALSEPRRNLADTSQIYLFCTKRHRQESASEIGALSAP